MNKTVIDTNKWVDQYGDCMYRYAFKRVNDKAVAEDLVQEAFVAALQHVAHFKGDSTEQTWLIGILRHKIMDFYRKKYKKPTVEIPDDCSDEEFFDKKGHWKTKPVKWRENPEELAQNRDFLAMLRKCLIGLPDIQQRVFSLREIQGIATDEICNLLEITTTNLNVMMFRARNSLRKCLENKWMVN